MSRVSLIEQLYAPKKKSALEFNYDALWAPPIGCLLSQSDLGDLHYIASSLKYNGNIEKKYELIDTVMKRRGFRRGNCGTNRVVYNFLEDQRFCFKVALDRVGMKDSPAEFINQEYFKPFCCKIFEVDQSGVVGSVERVNPISSLEEFLSIADDIFNMMITKIIGKYVVDDLGTEKFMNYGIRYNSNGVAFGPVVIDFPYAYKLDGAKLICRKPVQTKYGMTPCGGEIDYDAGLNRMMCTKCGRTYTAKELSQDDSNVIKFYSGDVKGDHKMRVRVIRRSDRSVVKDSGRSSNVYLSEEDFRSSYGKFVNETLEPTPVVETINNRAEPIKKFRDRYYTSLQVEAFNKSQEAMKAAYDQPSNPVVKTIKESGFNSIEYGQPGGLENYVSPEPTPVIETVNTNLFSLVQDTLEQDEEADIVESEVDNNVEDDDRTWLNLKDEEGDGDLIKAIVDTVVDAAKDCIKEKDEKAIQYSIEQDEYNDQSDQIDEPESGLYDEYNYENQDDYDDGSEEYSAYIKEDNKRNKRDNKREQSIRAKKNKYGDMSQY